MKYCIIIVSAFLLMSCADKYPMGLNKQEYTQLSKQEKIQLRKEQARLDNKLKIEKEKTKQKQKEIEKIKQQKIQALYSKGDHKNIIVVNITDGFHENYKLIPESIILARGESKNVRLEFSDKKGHITRQTLQINYDTSGTKVIIQFENFSRDKIALLNTGNWYGGTYYRNKNLVSGRYNKISDMDFQIRYFH